MGPDIKSDLPLRRLCVLNLIVGQGNVILAQGRQPHCCHYIKESKRKQTNQQICSVVVHTDAYVLILVKVGMHKGTIGLNSLMLFGTPLLSFKVTVAWSSPNFCNGGLCKGGMVAVLQTWNVWAFALVWMRRRQQYMRQQQQQIMCKICSNVTLVWNSFAFITCSASLHPNTYSYLGF